MTFSMIYASMLAVALMATVTDLRSGRIPNALTFPVILLAPPLHFVLGGRTCGVASSLGLLICGSIPWLFFRLGALGGGDVKLFAALGALGGGQLGLEVELLSLCLAFGYGVLRLSRRGELRPFLKGSLRVITNLMQPRSRREPVAAHSLTTLRMGGAIFAAVCLCVSNAALLRGQL